MSPKTSFWVHCLPIIWKYVESIQQCKAVVYQFVVTRKMQILNLTMSSLQIVEFLSVSKRISNDNTIYFQ